MTSLVNSMLAAHHGAPEPEVGMGATLIMWSDRRPYTIVEVVRYKGGKKAGQVKGVFATEDIATRTDSNGMSDNQHYTYETDPKAHRDWFPHCKTGAFRQHTTAGSPLRIGDRSYYYDYSF